jgi:hypothetical protein
VPSFIRILPSHRLPALEEHPNINISQPIADVEGFWQACQQLGILYPAHADTASTQWDGFWPALRQAVLQHWSAHQRFVIVFHDLGTFARLDPENYSKAIDLLECATLMRPTGGLHIYIGHQ